MTSHSARLTPPEFRTLPALMQVAMAEHPSSYAFNYREAGYWRALSSEQFLEQVRRTALGLIRLGLRPGDAVGVLAPPSPWWLISDFAILAAGGISVPMFPNLSDEHLVFEAQNTRLRYLVVIGEEAWTTASRHKGLFQHLIVRNIAGHRSQTVIDFAALQELGDKLSEQDPGLYARIRRDIDPNATATIIHTSGSTGTPKGVCLSHRNLISQVVSLAQLFPLDPALDRAFSCLPLAHVFERMAVLTYISQGVPLYFADDIKNLGELMREVRPTVITMVPRLLEKLHARIEKQASEAGGLKRRLGRWALDLADSPAAHHGWSVSIADALVYKKLRAALGGNLRYLVVGGAALAPTLERFLRNVGIPVYAGYGLTEASPVLAVNCPAAVKSGTVGRIFPGVEVIFGENQEILARGPNIMSGYYKDPEHTALTIDAQGWLHTGDRGELDSEGFLVITGRIKELFKTSNGKYICPVPIEHQLSECELIDMAMVIAEGRRFVSALLFTDPEVIMRRKAGLGLPLTDEAYLARPEVQDEIVRHLRAVNAGLDHWEQVRRWHLITVTPTIEREELTPTMKLRRHVLAERHAAAIEAMYAQGDVDEVGPGTPPPPLHTGQLMKEQP